MSGSCGAAAVNLCVTLLPQVLTMHPSNGIPHAEAVAVLLMSQAPTLRVLSMHFDVMPHQNLHALASLRSLTHLTLRDLPYHLQCFGYRVMHLQHAVEHLGD